MKRIMGGILIMFLLTACTADTNEQQKNIVETELKEVSEKEVLSGPDQSREESALNELIHETYEYKEPTFVDASKFSDMDYLLFVKEGKEYYTVSDVWFEHALLGNKYDTYEKGKEYYDKINLIYEKKLISANAKEAEAEYDQGVFDQYYKRNIVGFSADGKRVVLKQYVEPFKTEEILYQIYEGNKYLLPYLYYEIMDRENVNYTKNLKYVSLSREKDSFYESTASNYKERNRIYEITTISDAEDTVYACKEQDKSGNNRVRLYSIEDNKFIFETDPLEMFPRTIDIFEDKIILGYGNGFDRLNYFEINIRTNECKYLFTNPEGIFSPDSKYLGYASPFTDTSGPTKVEKGYYIYCLETEETAFYLTRVRDIENDRFIEEDDLNRVFCWVKKEGLDSLLND